MTLLDRTTRRASAPTETRAASHVHCEQLSFRYPGAETEALSGVNLDARAGKITALVGPSGCGKTTLLKLVGGLLEPTSGTVMVDGADATSVPMQRRGVGWVPQQYALFEHLDVTGNVAFGLRAHKVPAPERRVRVAEMLELCRITELASRSVAELSGGQRQRVAIARALAPYPKVLLLDEPLAALDPQLRIQLRAELAALIRAAGVTTLFVTHDQDEAFALADELVVLRAGEVVQSGPSAELWDRPADAWAARFLGHATVVPATGTTPGRARVAPGLEVPVDRDDHDQVALRVADLVASRSSGAGASGVVRTVEFAGEYYRLAVDLDGGPTVPGHALEPVQAGERVTVSSARSRVVPVVPR